MSNHILRLLACFLLLCVSAQGATITYPSGGAVAGITDATKSADYTTSSTDNGKRLIHSASDNNARTFTIEKNATAAVATGGTMLFENGLNTLTIAITSPDTLTLLPSGLGASSFRLAAGGKATAKKTGTTSWDIYGSDLSPVSIPIDMIIDLGSQTAGTAVTPTRMTNGSSTFTGWTVHDDPTVGFTIENGSNRFHSPFILGITTYPAGGTTNKRLALINANAATYATGTVPAGHKSATVAGFITLGDPAGDFDFYDMITIGGASSGSYAIVQHYNGTPYSINVETNPGGVTTHSDALTVNQGSTYWFSLHADYVTGTGSLKLFEISSWTQAGSVTFVMANSGEDVGLVRVGNAEAGNGTGTNYFENIIVDYTNGLQPLGP